MTFYHIDKVLSRKYGKISLTISNINDFDAVKGDIVEKQVAKRCREWYTYLYKYYSKRI